MSPPASSPRRWPTMLGRTIASLLKLPLANLLLVGSTGLDVQVSAIWNVGHGEGHWRSIPGPMPVGCRTIYGRCSPVLSATVLSDRRTVSRSAPHVVTLRPIAGAV